MSGTDERRAKLSPEKQALLAKRLSSLATAAAKHPAAPRQESLPASEPDLALDLAVAGEPVAPVSREVWRALVEAGDRAARRLEVAPGLLADAAREPRLDEQAAVFISTAFRNLGVFQEAGEAWTIDRLISERGVLPKHRKVLLRWMVALEEEGLLKRNGDSWVAVEPVPPPALEARIAEEQRRMFGKNLKAVLTG
ncbi:MAG TPA: hypothetical protein VG477_02205, partial [Thermoanaerobaculia bacterium]|nr:hypothetical protein [Thermoanaerobaculia bacterium]